MWNGEESLETPSDDPQQFNISHSSFIIPLMRSVPHLGAGCILAGRYEFEPYGGATVRTLGSNGLCVDRLVLIFFEPHELEAFGAATDLRCHTFPRTLCRAGC